MTEVRLVRRAVLACALAPLAALVQAQPGDAVHMLDQVQVLGQTP